MVGDQRHYQYGSTDPTDGKVTRPIKGTNLVIRVTV